MKMVRFIILPVSGVYDPAASDALVVLPIDDGGHRVDVDRLEVLVLEAGLEEREDALPTHVSGEVGVLVRIPTRSHHVSHVERH